MSIVSMIDTLFSYFQLKTKKSMSSYNFIETSIDDHTLVGKDGSLCSVIRINGVKKTMGATELNKLTEQITSNMSSYLDKPGHAFQVWFARDPDLSVDLVKRLTRPARAVAKSLSMELDDLFDEREKNLPKYIVWEDFYIVVWTRTNSLTKDELKKIKATSAPPKFFPRAIASQDIFQAVHKLKVRHQSLVSSFESDLNNVNIRSKVLTTHEAIKSIKASVYPDMTDADWKPIFPGDVVAQRTPEHGEFDISHLLWPMLSDQIFDRDAKVINKRICRIGRYYFSGIDVTIGPQDILPFAKLLNRMTENEEFPWRVSFLIEPNGLNFPMKTLLAGILGITNSENKQIVDAVKGLQYLKQSEGKVIVRYRVSFATWSTGSDLDLIEERSNRLQRNIESWGYCQTSALAGDPFDGTMSSAMGLNIASTAPPGAPPLEDVVYMLPWNRDASPWDSGAVLFRTEDGRPWPYQPGSSKQTTWIDLIFAPPGYAKSVFLNTTNLALCLSTAATAGSGGAQLPRIAIIDIGPSSSGLISLLKEALPANRRHEVEYKRLRMIKEHSINPFDTQLGCRIPLQIERVFLVNFLTILGTPVGDTKPPKALSDLAGMVIDEIYKNYDDNDKSGNPKLYISGEDIELDKKILEAGIVVSEQGDDVETTWWDIVDGFFAKDDPHHASLAQRFAVPLLEDITTVLRTQTIEDLYGEVRVEGESLIGIFERMISSALREYSILSVPTKFDLGEARVVALDLDEAAPRGGGPADKQTALVYMLARFVLAKDFYLNEDCLVEMPVNYHKYHKPRIQRIRETPKRLVYDEFHRTASTPVIRQQVLIDMREGRKWGVHIALASQSSDDFDKNMIDFATGVWVMGAGNDRAADEICHTFGLSDTANHIIKNKLHGPTSKGAPFLAILTLKDGKHEHLLVNTLGPTELWAFSTTAEDAFLRNQLYTKIGSVNARRNLAKRFPGGSAKPEIDRRIATMAEEGMSSDSPSDGVISQLVEELIRI